LTFGLAVPYEVEGKVNRASTLGLPLAYEYAVSVIDVVPPPAAGLNETRVVVTALFCGVLL
jgi:hypothetical protein